MNFSTTTRPLRSTPITGTSPLLRAGPPAHPATVLNPSRRRPVGGLPLAPHQQDSVGVRLPTFRTSAADRAHVACMPDTTWPRKRAPARFIPEPSCLTPVSMSPTSVTTRQQRFTHVRLPGPHLTPSPGAFSTSFTTTVFSQRSMWWFDASPRRATPKGQPSSLVQHRYSEHLPTHGHHLSFVAQQDS